MKRYKFTVVLSGIGETPEEGWEKAVLDFSLDPGDYPDEYKEGDDDSDNLLVEGDKPTATKVGDRVRCVPEYGDYHGVVKSWFKMPDGWMIVIDLGTNLMAFYEYQLEWEE